MNQAHLPVWAMLLIIAAFALLGIVMAAFAIKAWIAKHILGL